ncbi:MAG: lipopolysaccharide biosynthesis protein [Acidimicrobiales bacterium]
MRSLDDPPAPMTAQPDGIRRAAVSGVAWSLVQSWGGRIASTAAFVALARTLDPDDFGVIALAVIFIDLGQMLINRGFGASIIQREELTDEDLDSAFWFSVAAGAALAVVCVATAGLLADAFDEPPLASVLRVLALNWVFGALSSVPQSVLQRELRFRSLALRRLLAVCVSGAVGVTLAVAGAGVWSLVVMALVQSGVGVIVLWSVSSWRPRWRLSVARLRAMRRFAAGVVGIDFVRFFSVRGEAFLVGAAVGPIPLGYYAVATRFLQLLNEVFTSTVGTVAFPVFSRLQDDDARRRRALFSVVRMCALAAFPAFCGLAVLAPEFIATVLGSRWAPSVILSQLLALTGLRHSISYFIANVVLSTGNAPLALQIQIVGVVVKAVALAIGVQWGVEGVAWAVLISSYATFPVALWSLRRTTGIAPRDYLVNVSRPALAAATMVVAVVGVRALVNGLGDAATLVVGTVIGAITYVATLAVVAPSLFRELRGFLADAGRRRARVPASPEAVL